MKLRTSASASHTTSGPLHDRLYAVEPVGEATMMPSQSMLADRDVPDTSYTRRSTRWARATRPSTMSLTAT